MEAQVEIVHKPDRSTKRRQPIFMATVPAGFPCPAPNYEEGKLDLNKHLIKNPAATFFVSVAGDSMLKAALILGDFVPEGRVQGNLFDQADRRKSRRLMQAIDAVNLKLPDSPLIWGGRGHRPALAGQICQTLEKIHHPVG